MQVQERRWARDDADKVLPALCSTAVQETNRALNATLNNTGKTERRPRAHTPASHRTFIASSCSMRIECCSEFKLSISFPPSRRACSSCTSWEMTTAQMTGRSADGCFLYALVSRNCRALAARTDVQLPGGARMSTSVSSSRSLRVSRMSSTMSRNRICGGTAGREEGTGNEHGKQATRTTGS